MLQSFQLNPGSEDKILSADSMTTANHDGLQSRNDVRVNRFLLYILYIIIIK